MNSLAISPPYSIDLLYEVLKYARIIRIIINFQNYVCKQLFENYLPSALYSKLNPCFFIKSFKWTRLGLLKYWDICFVQPS
jgi:hypothetical protein